MLRPSRLFRSALGALFVLVMTGSASFAQYYYQPAPRYYPAPRYVPEPYGGPGYYTPGPRHQERRYLLEDDEDFRPRRRGNPNADYNHSRRGMGSVCVTSRGECSVGQYVPIGTGCKCRIPNFGQKRGHVQY